MKRNAIVLELIQTFDLNINEILGYKTLMKDLKLSSKNYIIAVVNIDYKLGNVFEKFLFEKNADEQFYESAPFLIRGLAKRASIQKQLNIIDMAMAEKLLAITNIPVIVADKDVVEIFSIE
ncbi:hypothetical protein GW758_01410 [Candidatus Falkowbacteria bacterium]|nr:hypothetical protein [Candidatus Falkowbacteria bacterium]